MVFIKRKKQEQKDFTVADILGKSEKKGHVGIEIELEGLKFNRTPVPPWTYHADGSLRGQDNAEYVVDGVLDFDEVNKAVDDLWAMMKKDGTTLDESDRTSVHVHLNVLPFYQNRLTALMSLWFIFEEVLLNYCGESRVGNHFCLSGKDASAVVSSLKTLVSSEGAIIPRENFHYAAFNAHAIGKFGSVEIRTLRGVNEPGVIKQWVAILRRLYELSEQYVDPRSIVEEFSLRGPVGFFEHVFGAFTGEIVTGAKLSSEQIRDMLYDGMRNAQDISYSRDWTDFKPTVLAKDVFGRKAKKKAFVEEEAMAVMEEPQWDDMPEPDAAWIARNDRFDVGRIEPVGRINRINVAPRPRAVRAAPGRNPQATVQALES